MDGVAGRIVMRGYKKLMKYEWWCEKKWKPLTRNSHFHVNTLKVHKPTPDELDRYDTPAGENGLTSGPPSCQSLLTSSLFAIFLAHLPIAIPSLQVITVQ